MKIIQQFSKNALPDEALHASLSRVLQKMIIHIFQGCRVRKTEPVQSAYYAYHQYIITCPEGEHIQAARERMGKIRPYSKAVYLDVNTEEFTRTYPKDTMIFCESQPGQELYIIQKGSVKITKFVNDNEQLLALLKPGDIFGEMSLLEDKPRSASAIAYEDAVLLAVNKANFKRMASTQPQIITRLTQLLSERIWFVYKQLSNTDK